MTAASAPRQAGATVVELLVAVVLLTVIAVSLSGAALYSSRLLERSRAELRASELQTAELERLLTLSWDSLADGSRSLPEGTSVWTVEDSGSYRRILVAVEYAGAGRHVVRDSVIAYRLRP